MDELLKAVEEMAEEIANNLSTLFAPQTGIVDASHAVDNGTATDEQLALITKIMHDAFDADDGCMIGHLKYAINNGTPHYFLNHAIRTYVRLCDQREMRRQTDRDASHNARYGKNAQETK